MFNLYEEVIRPSHRPDPTDQLSKVVSELAKSNRSLSKATMGARSQHKGKTVGKLVRYGSTSPEKRRFLRNLTAYFNCRTVYELGTSIGITTLYLSEKKDCHVFTFEGNEELADFARQLFDETGRKNIRIIKGNIDERLPEILASEPPPDLIYIDANHRYDPTLRYVRQAISAASDQLICVIGDIYWSPEMTRAWQDIKKLEEVTVSADLFDVGVLFFKKELTKEHYVL